jgi:hypothetical protein
LGRTQEGPQRRHGGPDVTPNHLTAREWLFGPFTPRQGRRLRPLDQQDSCGGSPTLPAGEQRRRLASLVETRRTLVVPTPNAVADSILAGDHREKWSPVGLKLVPTNLSYGRKPLGQHKLTAGNQLPSERPIRPDVLSRNLSLCKMEHGPRVCTCANAHTHTRASYTHIGKACWGHRT